MKIVGNIIAISAVLVLFMGAAQLMQFKKVFFVCGK
jgi:hypothetical protein